jgi:transcriptional regulator with XRE-family HTH domain
MYPNLKLQIWKNGIRQNRLAKLLGMDETMLSRIVNGYRNPNAQLRQSIADLLSCDPAWLFEELEPTPEPSSSVRANTKAASEPQ